MSTSTGSKQPRIEGVVALGNVSGATTIDASTGNFFTCTGTANVTFGVANVKPGQSITVRFTQGGVGGWTTAWTGGPQTVNSAAASSLVAAVSGVTIFNLEGSAVNLSSVDLTGTSSSSGGGTGGVDHETITSPDDPATAKGSIGSNQAAVSPTTQPFFPVNFQVVFEGGWDGGDITVTGRRTDNTAATETFTSPGIGGGTVVGNIPFASITSPNGITNSISTGAGATHASVQTGSKLGVAPLQVSGFTKILTNSSTDTFSASSNANGTFTPTLGVSSANIYDVWYTR